MSNKFTTTQIRERFESLPDDMKAVISSSDTASLIQTIGTQYGLRIDAIGALVEYSGLIMLGLIKSEEFVDALVRETGVDREKAANMALDVDTQVFSQVRNSLRQAQYTSTSENRFETGSDFAKPITPNTPPTPEPVLDFASTRPISQDIPMSQSDYDPNAFVSGSIPDVSPLTDTEQEAQPVSSTGPSALEQAVEKLDGAFETPMNPSTTDSVALNMNTSPAKTMNSGFNSALVEQEVSRSIANETMKNMPKAMQDTYKTGQATAPAPQASEAVIKDFQTILEEKMSQTDTSHLNNDPYKESI